MSIRSYVVSTKYNGSTYISIATGSGHPDYPGHLGHFLSGSKWVSPGHAYMPDSDSYQVH